MANRRGQRAADNSIHKGDVWTFTAESFAYPVQNIIATTNATSEEDSPIENTINGSGLNAQDQHSIAARDMWLATPPVGEATWIQYEFPRVEKLYQMLVWNYNVQFELILGFGLMDVATSTPRTAPIGRLWGLSSLQGPREGHLRGQHDG
jgi:hypothetical protein